MCQSCCVLYGTNVPSNETPDARSTLFNRVLCCVLCVLNQEEKKKMKRSLKEIRLTKYRRALLEGRTQWNTGFHGDSEPWWRTVKSSFVNRLSLCERGKGGIRRRGKMFYALNMTWWDSVVSRRYSNAVLRNWDKRILREEVLDWWESREEEKN